MFGRIALRRFSTDIRKMQLVKCPIPVTGVHGRYAAALYSAAVKSNILQKVETEIKDVQHELLTKPDVRNAIIDPFFNRVEKKQSIAKMLDKLHASNITKRFFELLAENGRLTMVDTILNTFGRVMSAHRGEVLCQVTTAKPLDLSGKNEINKVLQSLVTPGRKINVEYNVDPSLLAGMTLSVGDQFIDMSTVSKIARYTKALEAAL